MNKSSKSALMGPMGPWAHGPGRRLPIGHPFAARCPPLHWSSLQRPTARCGVHNGDDEASLCELYTWLTLRMFFDFRLESSVLCALKPYFFPAALRAAWDLCRISCFRVPKSQKIRRRFAPPDIYTSAGRGCPANPKQRNQTKIPGQGGGLFYFSEI